MNKIQTEIKKHLISIILGVLLGSQEIVLFKYEKSAIVEGDIIASQQIAL